MESVDRVGLECLYRDRFKPEDYVATYYSCVDLEVQFFLQNLHTFFSTLGKENSLAGRIVGQEEAEKRLRRVLEIGSGPVPISMISASLWCEWIVCSDFLEQNRQKIKQWLMTNTVVQPPGRHDETWLPFFKYVAQLERAEPEYLLDRVRRSVRRVVPCNVLLSNPLADYKEAADDSDAIADVPSSSYDVIISTLCLEFASLSHEEYSTAVRNVARLLRPSGYFIMQGALGNSHYWHNNHRFPSVSLNRSLVEEALINAGCQTIEWKELARCCPPEDKPADHFAVFYCLARKI